MYTMYNVHVAFNCAIDLAVSKSNVDKCIMFHAVHVHVLYMHNCTYACTMQ